MKRKLFFALLGISLSIGIYESYEHLQGRSCNPKGKCTACKNCTGCKNCHHNGGTCSVCRR